MDRYLVLYFIVFFTYLSSQANAASFLFNNTARRPNQLKNWEKAQLQRIKELREEGIEIDRKDLLRSYHRYALTLDQKLNKYSSAANQSENNWPKTNNPKLFMKQFGPYQNALKKSKKFWKKFYQYHQSPQAIIDIKKSLHLVISQQKKNKYRNGVHKVKMTLRPYKTKIYEKQKFIKDNLQHFYLREFGLNINEAQKDPFYKKIIDKISINGGQNLNTSTDNYLEVLHLLTDRFKTKNGIDYLTWLDENLKQTLSLMPESLVKKNSMSKVYKLVIGYTVGGLRSLTLEEDKLDDEQHDLAIFRIIQISYHISLSYIIDDLLDESDILSKEKKQQVFSNILKGLKGNTDGIDKNHDDLIGKLLIKTFKQLQYFFPFQDYKELYQETIVFHLAQLDEASFKSKRLNFNQEEYYTRVILKAAYSRKTWAHFTNNIPFEKEKRKKFEERNFIFGLNSQLWDDLSDYFKDKNQNIVSTFTFYEENKSHFSNPLLLSISAMNYAIKLYCGDDESMVRKMTYLTFNHLIYHLKAHLKSQNPKCNLKSFMTLFDPGDDEIKGALMEMAQLPKLQKLLHVELLKKKDSEIIPLFREVQRENPHLFLGAQKFYFEKNLEKSMASLMTNSRNASIRRLNEAIFYQMLPTNGRPKRIRPLMTFAMANMLDMSLSKLNPLATAIELYHASSLIYDDLPAQDDAKMRHNQPVLHLAFDEYTAQLAGLSMLFMADEKIKKIPYSDSKINRISTLKNSYCGVEGLCGGQMMDLDYATGKIKVHSVDDLMLLHQNKTGKAIAFSFIAPAILEDLSDKVINDLEKFSYSLGLLFQIKDDLLDLSESDTGKDKHLDEQNRNQTYVTLLGVQGAQDKLDETKGNCLHLLKKLKKHSSDNESRKLDTRILESFVDIIYDRQY